MGDGRVGAEIGGYCYKPFFKWKQKPQHPNAKTNIFQRYFRIRALIFISKVS